jgi:molybdopterin molybdotransferase
MEGSFLSDLLSVEEAQQKLLSAFSQLGSEPLYIQRAVGRILAEPIFSPIDLPSFTNSAMDGFAIRAEDLTEANLENPLTLEVIADIPAGRATDVKIRRGQAARIMTGAALPGGADAVIPIEDTNHYQDNQAAKLIVPSQVIAYRSVIPGENIRPKGQDVGAGQTVLSSRVRLRPQDIGLLSMLGIEHVLVVRRPRIALLSTGDELIPLGEPIRPGLIHDSNTYMLSALISQDEGESINLGITRDTETAIFDNLEKAVINRVDLIVSSAGVSVGAFDFVRTVVEKHGSVDFWRVNMRPGKPLAFGNYRDIPFIGLPGNPVSAFVGYLIFVRPAIQKMSGNQDQIKPVIQARLLEAIVSDGRESYLRAMVFPENGSWKARLTGHQGSGNLLSLVQANALLIIPSGVKSLPVDSEVNAWML